MAALRFLPLVLVALGCAAATPAHGVRSFDSEDAGAPRVVLVAGEDEHGSAETLAELARLLEERHGLDCVLLVARARDDVPGLEALAHADLAVFYLRYRTLPDEQLEHVLSYVRSGRPVLGLRTSTHAFLYPPEDPRAAWNDGFGTELFGQRWLYHYGHGSRTTVRRADASREHPILDGVATPFESRAWLYHVNPLPQDCTVLLTGTAIDSDRSRTELEPVAWARTSGGRRAFYTSLGERGDFGLAPVRRLLVNAVHWCLGRAADG